jgi:hypothetical protein
VKVGNHRTFSLARSAGTATNISVAPISIQAASHRITGSIALLPFTSVLRFFDILGLFLQQMAARVTQYGHSPNRDRRKPKPPAL